MKRGLFLVASAVFLLTAEAHATIGPNYVSGNITNISSYGGGLMIMVNGGEVPTNCASAPGWILIRQQDQAMVSTALSMYLANRLGVSVYTNAIASSGSGYCEANQFDPN